MIRAAAIDVISDDLLAAVVYAFDYRSLRAKGIVDCRVLSFAQKEPVIEAAAVSVISDDLFSIVSDVYRYSASRSEGIV